MTIEDLQKVINLSKITPYKVMLEGEIATLIVAWELDCKDTDMWRVQTLPNGKLRLNDLTLPFYKTRDTMEVFKQDAPKWIVDAIDVLAICDIGDVIPNIGKRISEDTYYVKEVGLQVRS